MLGTRDLGRVKTAVDMDERLSLAGELARRRVGQPGRMRQPLRDLPVTLDLLEVLGARDEREVHRAALTRRARFDEPHVFGRGRELPKYSID